MRILIALGLTLAAGMFQATPSQAQGTWCQRSDSRDIDCSHPSFASCHFSTLGEGGGCYANVGWRGRAEAYYPAPRAQAWFDARYYEPAPYYGSARYYEPARYYASTRYYEPAPMPAWTWCYRSENTNECDSQPSFEVCHFTSLGDGGVCYPRMHHAAVRVRHGGAAFAQVRRHRSAPGETQVAVAAAPSAVAAPNQVACAEPAASTTDGAPACPGVTEPPATEAMASAQPIAARSAQALAVPHGMPSFNVLPSCRAFAAVMGGASAQQEFDHCLASENDARTQIVQQWNAFAAADRAGCAAMTGASHGGTYTEYLSCLEMRAQAKNLQKSDPSTRVAAR